MPELLQFVAAARVVVDFAVEDDDGIAVVAMNGLIAALPDR